MFLPTVRGRARLLVPLLLASTRASPTRCAAAPALRTLAPAMLQIAANPNDERKAAKKAATALRRAKRQGEAPSEMGQKSCDLCSRGVDLLIRCQIDESRAWKMVCGKCWNGVSGGVPDGDAQHPHYRYGGLWKKR